jgi:hypothetical protein
MRPTPAIEQIARHAEIRHKKKRREYQPVPAQRVVGPNRKSHFDQRLCPQQQ